MTNNIDMYHVINYGFQYLTSSVQTSKLSTCTKVRLDKIQVYRYTQAFKKLCPLYGWEFLINNRGILLLWPA